MHPACSAVLFTTFSGLGCGLLVLLGLMGGFGIIAADRGFGVAAFALALTPVTLGLLTPPLHLGHREGASRGFRRWRTSWRSREDIATFATYLPTGVFALGWIFFGRNGDPWALAGIASAGGGLLIIYCTAMTYADIPTLHARSNRWTVPAHFALALATGSLWLAALARLFAIDRPAITHLPLALILAAWILKALYWARFDRVAAGSPSESATGSRAEEQKADGAPAHQAGKNFVMQGIGLPIVHRRTRRLRRAAQILGFLLPLALTELAMFLPEGSPAFAIAAAFAGALSGTMGALMERWLLFAEARHAVDALFRLDSNGAARR